ncbi:MAG: MBL fold metallo-hydrolase [Bryobacteraceae bacterium]
MSPTNHTGSGNQLKLEFWGVRGSVPTPERAKLTLGGNTPCTVLQYNSEPVVIIDGGTGLRSYGLTVACGPQKLMRASLLFSHFHWDHIQGLPFFGAVYSDFAQLSFYSTLPADELRAILEVQMSAPYFPLPMSSTRAAQEYFQMGVQGSQIGSLKITPVPLNHPGGASGYRIDSPAGSVIYVSDHEHGVAEIDDTIAKHATGADVLIYDAHFTPAEYENYKGWGHSTWLEATRLANRSGVGELILFHHNPSRKDREMPEILAEARREFAATEIARENHTIILPSRRVSHDTTTEVSIPKTHVSEVR